MVYRASVLMCQPYRSVPGIHSLYYESSTFTYSLCSYERKHMAGKPVFNSHRTFDCNSDFLKPSTLRTFCLPFPRTPLFAISSLLLYNNDEVIKMWFLLLIAVCSFLSVMNLEYFFPIMSIPFAIALFFAALQYSWKENLLILLALPIFIIGLLTF